MKYTGEPIKYYYKTFTVPSNGGAVEIMYIRPAPSDLKLIEYSSSLWKSLREKVEKKYLKPVVLMIDLVESCSDSTRQYSKYLDFQEIRRENCQGWKSEEMTDDLRDYSSLND